MRCRAYSLRALGLVIAVGVGLTLLPANRVFGQFQASGVVVDAQGTMQRKVFNDPTGQLTRQRAMAARAALDPDIVRPSKLRKVSLNRLERLLVARNGQMTDDMRNLAGLLRVQYVFYYPDTKDIVLAGPAEGWMQDISGRTVGFTSGRPTIQLQDLVVALRSFAPEQKNARVIGCSIDPTEEGLARLQRYLVSVGGRVLPHQTQLLVANLRESLGLQNITVRGVPADTHFAQVLVEADYRMKLIGIGLEKPPVRMVSFIDRASPGAVARNALFRWYFVPDYECVRRSEDGLAMELVGNGVKLIGEDELVSQQGGRRVVGRGNTASQAFVTSFTENYAQLAERSPVYAELRNLIDLSVAAAYIKHEGFYTKAAWKMEFFGDEQAFSVETYQAPKTVGSAVGAVWRGQQLMTPIGGGVQIDALMALEPERILEDEKQRVARLRDETTLELADDQWWWD